MSGEHTHDDLAGQLAVLSSDLTTTKAALTALAVRVAKLEAVPPDPDGPPDLPPPPSPPPPPPVSTGLYGPFLAADTLNNSSTDEVVEQRFIADRSAKLHSVGNYIEVNGTGQSGYSKGDGGLRDVTLVRESTGAVLATTVSPLVKKDNTRFQDLVFDADLIAGEAYRVKYVQRSPGSAWVSINNLYTWDQDATQLRYDGWRTIKSGNVEAGRRPILELRWADGVKTGIGYYGLSQVSPNQPTIGGSNQVRQRITPKADVTFTEAWVRLQRDSGTTTPLTVTIAGKSATIAASTFPVGTAADASSNQHRWGIAVFPSTTLKAGTQYDLVLSSSTGPFRAAAMGRDGFGLTVGGEDGSAQRSTDGGSTWGPLMWYGGTNANQDIQFGLR